MIRLIIVALFPFPNSIQRSRAIAGKHLKVVPFNRINEQSCLMACNLYVRGTPNKWPSLVDSSKVLPLDHPWNDGAVVMAGEPDSSVVANLALKVGEI